MGTNRRSTRFQRPGDGASPGTDAAEYHPGVAARTVDDALSRLSRPAPDTRHIEARDMSPVKPGGTANEYIAPDA
jgi:hypothetical protein